MTMAQKDESMDMADVADEPMNGPVTASDAMDVVPRELEFGADPAMPLPVVTVTYKEMPMAYDLIDMETKTVYDWITSGEKIVFKFRDKYFSTELDPLKEALEDKSATFYECNKELLNAPFIEDVYPEIPYFRLQLNGNFMVLESELRAAVASENGLFELVTAAKKLPFAASYGSIQASPGIDYLGRQVDISGAAHCQKGSDQVTYNLKLVKMVKQGAGKKTRKTKKPKKKTTYRKAKKSNKRKTIRRRK